MTELAGVMAQPRGARFYRADLHIGPFGGAEQKSIIRAD
jgi:hypothetical protein